MASACTLGPWQCLPGPVFRPRNLNIKIGPGDEANLEVDEPHDYDTVFVMKGGGWVFDGAAKCTKVDN